MDCQYAPPTYRAVAGVLDAVIFGTIILLLLAPLTITDDSGWVRVVLWTLEFGYCWVILTLWSTTPGKKILGMAVVSLEGHPLTYRRAFLRVMWMTVLSVVGSSLPVIGLAQGAGNIFVKLAFVLPALLIFSPIFFNRKRQTVYDLLAKTTVVVVRPKGKTLHRLIRSGGTLLYIFVAGMFLLLFLLPVDIRALWPR